MDSDQREVLAGLIILFGLACGVFVASVVCFVCCAWSIFFCRPIHKMFKESESIEIFKMSVQLAFKIIFQFGSDDESHSNFYSTVSELDQPRSSDTLLLEMKTSQNFTNHRETSSGNLIETPPPRYEEIDEWKLTNSTQDHGKNLLK